MQLILTGVALQATLSIEVNDFGSWQLGVWEFGTG